VDRNRIGIGSACYLLGAPGLNAGKAITASQTAEVRSKWVPIPSMTKLSLQLVSEGTRRIFLANGTTDAASAGPTWTLANGAFVAGDVTGFLIVRGTVSNDGIYSIATRSSATVITTGGTITAETFPATAQFTVVPPGLVDGNWVIRLSNDYNDGTAGRGLLGAVGNQGVIDDTLAHFTDIAGTSAFFKGGAIAAVAHGTASTRNQYALLDPPGARMLQVAFLPSGTAGAGFVYAIVNGVS
jgi:hypothetical protein